ncbi:MAG: DUF6157 family protein [Clostridiales bacterium]|jgi:hypothetical protein|nr:DUF6157 family protein [Clostridiales bacterium]
MKYTTNLTNTFIQVSLDCPVQVAKIPISKGNQTAVSIEYEMIANNPYKFTSDQVLYQSNGVRRGLSEEEFFSKGQPCLRASALPKRYGFGVHFDEKGRVAIYAVQTQRYQDLVNDMTISQVKAMRNKKN